VRALEQVDAWPVRTVAAGVARASGVVAARGAESEVFRWASVTKVATAMGALVALEEGVVDLDDAAGPPGSTVRHLFAHASGLPMNEGPPIAPPGRRRIYSNAGFETLAGHVEHAAGMPFADYLSGALVEPLELEAELRGSPAWAMRGRLEDLLAIARELLAPTLVARETLAEATTVVFPGLTGVLPGFGRLEPNDWGLGFELRDDKSPHWTGARNSPRTFGHFGASGTFLWVDPDHDLALAVLTDHEFGEWAREAWPRLADDVLAEAA
jgi:CubicO group peptidase (beta-lactamase class C family)